VVTPEKSCDLRQKKLASMPAFDNFRNAEYTHKAVAPREGMRGFYQQRFACRSRSFRSMKKSEMKPYKETLLALRARLRGDVKAMANAALNTSGSESNGEHSRMPIHMADLGSDNFEQEFTLSLMETEEGTLELVVGALERIEDGVYGTCEECGGVISKLRLQAIPYAPFCIRCAEKRESR
jgi:RNA polymerase-binding transcription factor DksA